ncbi:lytic transglycosylase domain-containing protein [Geobacter sp. FeAm09]|uniref:lytic transglycosylase domain-containing protein n=1 Tax=Geobacter sp. FeAm09 TaxID=2597769 RepID=UPI0011F05FF3|nr:lytic transglycosylase domain-containing protein [Geobacter sp. FeAm09]QEM69307.1 lytic transglycosylase domain-containing protein [Geobacter sp. FeAm09]
MTTKHLKMACLLALVVVGVARRDACSFCFDEAGEMYGINPLVLRAIAKVESNFAPETINRNSNGTFDIGLMQINTIWKPVLGEKRWQHLGDACYNTKTGAWILATCISKYGYNWKAIGCYNSQTPGKSEVYAKKVFDRLKQLERHKEPQPVDSTMKAVMLGQINDLVESAQQGRAEKKVVKFVPYVRVPRQTLRNPPPAPGDTTPQEFSR